jgi:anti-sigma factor RsiW
VNCQEMQTLFHGYLDGELDLVNSLKVEEHLKDCRSCSQEQANNQTLRAALRGGELYFQPPPSLHKRVLSNVARVSRHSAASVGPRTLHWSWLGAAAVLVAAVVITWGLTRGFVRQPPDVLVAQEVVASHVRSLMPDHLTDVTSSSQHTVKPWFAGKLNFSPPVLNLASEGFPLIGGRLDYLDNQPVAALVYGRQQHKINLFIWPSTSAAATQTEVRQGYQLVHWTQSGMNYWVVSDMNAAELEVFVLLIQKQAGA